MTQAAGVKLKVEGHETPSEPHCPSGSTPNSSWIALACVGPPVQRLNGCGGLLDEL